ncbi:MAG: hypothetical protein U0412_14745 [Nitrospira sp.]
MTHHVDGCRLQATGEDEANPGRRERHRALSRVQYTPASIIIPGFIRTGWGRAPPFTAKGYVAGLITGGSKKDFAAI